jgi:hypothetical protein
VSPRRTRAKDLRRRTASRPERRTIVVFCEGVVSEPNYVNGLNGTSFPEDNPSSTMHEFLAAIEP